MQAQSGGAAANARAPARVHAASAPASQPPALRSLQLTSRATLPQSTPLLFFRMGVGSGAGRNTLVPACFQNAVWRLYVADRGV